AQGVLHFFSAHRVQRGVKDKVENRGVFYYQVKQQTQLAGDTIREGDLLGVGQVADRQHEAIGGVKGRFPNEEAAHLGADDQLDVDHVFVLGVDLGEGDLPAPTFIFEGRLTAVGLVIGSTAITHSGLGDVHQ